MLGAVIAASVATLAISRILTRASRRSAMWNIGLAAVIVLSLALALLLATAVVMDRTFD